MDISIFDKTSIKIRFRYATFVVDPAERGTKVSSDAIILLNGEGNLLSKAVDYRVIINGPGEYEINGVKVLGVRVDKGFVYSLASEGFLAILGRSGEISKISVKGGSPSVHKEEFNTECQIAILNVDDEFNQSIIAALEPKVAILYGEKKESGAKVLGKANVSQIKKFTITKDKLPEEMEVVVLG